MWEIYWLISSLKRALIFDDRLTNLKPVIKIIGKETKAAKIFEELFPDFYVSRLW